MAATTTLMVVCRSSAQSYVAFYLLGAGGLYGVATGWSWVASASRNRWLRVTLRTTIVICFAFLLRVATQDSPSWLRYVTQLGGIIVSQCVLFHLFRVPTWRATIDEQHEIDEMSEPTPKFSILDVMLVTSALGVLLSMARLYTPPTLQSQYWPVTIVLWVYFAVLATITVGSGPTGGSRHRAIRILVLLLLIGLGNFGLTWIQTRQSDDVSTMFWQFYFFYLLFIIGFVVAVSFFSLAGVVSRVFPNKRSPKGH